MSFVVTSALRRTWILSIVAATLAYYFWSAVIPSGVPPRIKGEERDHFNLLSHGFRNGQLHLDHAVSPELLASPNPYDPALRKPGMQLLYDASFYQGKYYIYFGPAPVVTLLLPFRLLTGRDLPLTYAVWVYCSAGYVVLVGIFLFLQRRHFPQARWLSITIALVGLGGASMLTALLRRPHMWELAIASGFAFSCASLYCLIRAIHTARPLAWATLGGIALGFAVASRPTYLLCSVLFTLPWIFGPRGKGAIRTYDWRTVIGAAIGCSIPVLALLTYNYARFGEALEFGQKYQLTGIIESEGKHFSLTYWWVNFRLYFLSPLTWTTRFPFVDRANLPSFPPGHLGHEYTFGLLPNLPFAFLALALFAPLFLPQQSPGTAKPFRISVAATGGATAISIALLLSYFGCCIRYMADFTPPIMLLAALGILAGDACIRSRALRATWLAAAALLAVFSSLMAAAGVVRFYESEAGGYPSGYRWLARTLDASVLRWRERQWQDFGPREFDLSFPADRTPRCETILTVRQHGKDVACVLVEYLDDRHVRLGYREMGDSRPVAYSLPASAPAGARHKLALTIGDAFSTADGPGGRVRARLDHVHLWDAPVVSFAAYSGDLRLGSLVDSDHGSRFTGTMHAVQAIDSPSSPLRYEGIRARITLKPEMAGKSYPLLTTGRTKAADFLILEVHPDHGISFAYDHWGRPLIASPKIPAAPHQTRVIDFWVPALAPAGSSAPLLVKVDGVTVWETSVAAYSIDPDTLSLGTNFIGGSNCDRLLVNAVFEDVQMPRPAR